MVQAETDGTRIWLWADFRQKDLIKLVPGSRWDTDRRQWSVPLSWAACMQLRGVFGDQLQICEQLWQWASAERMNRVEPSLAMRLATDADGDPNLFPFQRAGVRFLVSARQAILGDEMGTGKTVQIAVTLRELDESYRTAEASGFDGTIVAPSPFPCLIVAPKSVKRNWVRELEKWCPGINVIAPPSGAANLRKALADEPDVVIVNYENTWRFSRLSGYGSMRLSDAEKKEKDLNHVPWATVVVDEAHKIKDPKAKQTRAIWWLGHQPSVTYRYALTGTPIAKAPDDLWSVLHFISPDEFAAKTAYVDRYCLQTWNAWGGMEVVGIRPEMKAEFFGIVDSRMRRMPKDLVLPWLPPKVRSIREAEMTAKQRKAYEEMEDRMVAEVADGDYTAAVTPLVARLRKMQFASAYAQLDDEGNVRLSEPSNKVDELMDLLGELGDEPLVVFAQSRQLIELAAARLEKAHISYRLLVGGMSELQREASMSDFQEGRARVMLGTIAAAGEGVTLTRARHLVFLQRHDSMLGNKQAEDRIHRIGAEVHERVHIIDIVTPGTVELKQIENLHLKFARLQEIVRDRETLQHAAANGDQAAAAKLADLALEEAELMSWEVTS